MKQFKIFIFFSFLAFMVIGIQRAHAVAAYNIGIAPCFNTSVFPCNGMTEPNKNVWVSLTGSDHASRSGKFNIVTYFQATDATGRVYNEIISNESCTGGAGGSYTCSTPISNLRDARALRVNQTFSVTADPAYCGPTPQ